MVYTKSKVIDKPLFKRAINFFMFATSITIIATIITYILNPDLKEIIEGMEESLPDQVTESTGINLVWSFIVNNGFMVPLQMFILALLPIQFLYVVNIIVTVSLLGIVFGVVLQADIVEGFGLVIASIPHSVVEVFAFCLFAAVLLKLNRVIRAKIRNIFKKEKEGISLIKKILETLKVYIILVLPLIIVAAFLETYIPDMIFSLFQS